MTPTASSTAPSRRCRQQAALVAGLLRISRLTVLYGERGAGKTTLLKRSVLPLLGRRSDDRYGGGHRAVVVPFPDRREVRDRPVEIALYFDSWSEAPLTELQTRIASALTLRRLQVSPPFPPLAESLAAWSRRLGVRFLLMFDHFETLSATQRARPGVREFEDALVALVNSTSPANVLLAICDEDARSLVQLGDRIPGFGDASVRLPPVAGGVPADPEEEAARPNPVVAPIEPATATEAALAALREWKATTAVPHATTAEALDVLRAWRPRSCQ